jgi:hypothetical protein
MWMPLLVDEFVVLPNWVIVVVFPVPAAPERISPQRALIACRLSNVNRWPVCTTWWTAAIPPA